jgi:hypothetical protein
MPKIVTDKYSKLDISPQYRYQLRKAAASKCVICGRPRSRKSRVYCARHLAAVRIRSLKQYHSHRKQIAVARCLWRN